MIHDDVTDVLGTNGGLVILAGASIIVLGGAMLAAGLAGLAVGGAILAVWLVLGTPPAIGAATVLLVATTPSEPAPLQVGAVCLVLGAIALAPHVGRVYPRSVVGGAASIGVALGGIVLLSISVWSLWVVSGLTLLLVALAAYAIHRYHVVSLGLLDGVTPSE